MLDEVYGKKATSYTDSLVLSETPIVEHVRSSVIGEYFDQDVNTGEVLHNWKKNLIVLDFGRLLAALCKAHAGFSGMQYWEVGAGDPSWDTNIPSPQVGDTQLLAPHTRVATTIFFLDSSNNRVTDPAVITNKLELESMFAEGTATGALREFGIFGGNTTSALGSGIMCDRVIHPVINKPANMALLRKIRFTF